MFSLAILYSKLGFFVICSQLSLNAHIFKASTELHTKTDTELVTQRTPAKIGDFRYNFSRQNFVLLATASKENGRILVSIWTLKLETRSIFCGTQRVLFHEEVTALLAVSKFFRRKKEADSTLKTDRYCCSQRRVCIRESGPTPSGNMFF